MENFSIRLNQTQTLHWFEKKGDGQRFSLSWALITNLLKVCNIFQITDFCNTWLSLMPTISLAAGKPCWQTHLPFKSGERETPPSSVLIHHHRGFSSIRLTIENGLMLNSGLYFSWGRRYTCDSHLWAFQEWVRPPGATIDPHFFHLHRQYYAIRPQNWTKLPIFCLKRRHKI